MLDYNYKKRFINSNGLYQIEQWDNDKFRRIIDENHYDVIKWLDYGNLFEEIAYQEPEPIVYTNEQIEELRKKAYEDRADPLFFEYQELLALGNTTEAEEKKNAWLNKKELIREEYPYSS